MHILTIISLKCMSRIDSSFRYPKSRLIYFPSLNPLVVELLTFGDFMRLYDFYYNVKGNVPVSYKVLNLVRNLRNGCAHNNCILADLTPHSSVPPSND